MARGIYKIDEFRGIDQSRDENRLDPSSSPDACNMDTSGGCLSVAKGYVRHIAAAVPGAGALHRMTVFAGASGDRFIVAAGNSLYAWNGASWNTVHTFSPALSEHRFSFVQARIGTADYLIIGTGEGQLIKYDGTSAAPFGSPEDVSNIPVRYLAMYKGRLFSAGDAQNPARLYWSQLPGDGRSIEKWGPVEASPNVEGGHSEVGGAGRDPIVALAAMSNQLLIFKERSVYRLIGDRPGNFIIEEVDSAAEGCADTAIVKRSDALYFIGKDGVCCFNGVAVSPLADARSIRAIMARSSAGNSRGALSEGKLYFTIDEEGAAAMLEYDLARRVYMLRRGFSAADICAWKGALYILDGGRRICRFNEGDTYDGAPVEAYWRTPLTDLGDKGAIKAMRSLYLRGEADGADSALLADVRAGGNIDTHRLLLAREAHEVLEVPLRNEGRAFSLKFYNEAGGRFTLRSGAELVFEQWRRVE